MKLLAVFLGMVFLFSPAAVRAQGDKKDCGFAPALKAFTVERTVRVGPGPELEIVSPQIVEDLEDGQDCLNLNLMRVQGSVKDLQHTLSLMSDNELDILDLQDKTKQTESKLSDDETTIKTLEDKLDAAEREIEFLNRMQSKDLDTMDRVLDRLERLEGKPKPAASKPQAPVNKPKPAR